MIEWLVQCIFITIHSLLIFLDGDWRLEMEKLKAKFHVKTLFPSYSDTLNGGIMTREQTRPHGNMNELK